MFADNISSYDQLISYMDDGSESDEDLISEDVVIQVTYEETLQMCKEGFEKEENGVSTVCKRARVLRWSDSDNASLYYAFYIEADSDPFVAGLTYFTMTRTPDGGWLYTTLFIPLEYKKRMA